MGTPSPDDRYARQRRRPTLHRAQQPRPRHPRRHKRIGYVPVRGKFTVATALSLIWFAVCCWLALPWMRDLARITNWPVSLLVIGGIALVPGFMNAFLAISILVDQRPPRLEFEQYPPSASSSPRSTRPRSSSGRSARSLSRTIPASSKPSSSTIARRTLRPLSSKRSVIHGCGWSVSPAISPNRRR